MYWLAEVAINNAFAATALALVAFLVTRCIRKPVLCHALWVLVILKLVTPPIVSVPVPDRWISHWHPDQADSRSRGEVDRSAAGELSQAAPRTPMAGVESSRHTTRPVEDATGGSAAPVEFVVGSNDTSVFVEPPERIAAEDAMSTWEDALAEDEGVEYSATPVLQADAYPPAAPPITRLLAPLLFSAWIMGSLLVFFVTGFRVYRFQRLLRAASYAPADLQAEVRELAARLGTNRCPQVCLLPGTASPMLWALFGTPKILFPKELLHSLGSEARRTLLLHELSHLKRRDHWVRLLEVVVTGLYWWHPVVWWARREIRLAEESCCDSWVVSEMPSSRQTYADALVQTVRYLANARVVLPPATSGIGGFTILKRRVTMIMLEDHKKGASALGRAVIAAAAVICLPFVPALGQKDPSQPEADQAESRDSDATAAEPSVDESLEGDAAAATQGDQADEPIAFSDTPQLLTYDRTNARWIAISPDGKLLAVAHGSWSTSGLVRLWDLADRKELVEFSESIGITSVAFSPDGRRFVYGVWNGTVKIVEIATKQTVQIRTVNPARVAFSPDGKMVATASELPGKLKLWDAASGKMLREFGGELFRLQTVAFSPDGSLLAAAGGPFRGDRFGRVSVWDTETGEQLTIMNGHTGPVLGMDFSPDGKTIASASVDATVRLWDAVSGDPKLTFEDGGRQSEGVGFSPDGKWLAIAHYGGTVTLRDTATGERLTGPARQKGVGLAATFTPDGKTLATGSAHRVRLWDTATWEETAVLEPETARLDPPSPILSVACSPDGTTIASAHEDMTVRLRDARTGRVHRVLRGHKAVVSCIAFSPDGKTVATASCDKTLKLWDARSGDEQHTLSGHTRWVLAVAFSPDGKTLASGGSDNTVRLWDVATCKQKAVLEGHTEMVRCLAFSADGKSLATGSTDKTVRIWDVQTQKEVSTLEERNGGALAFSSDGKTLASFGEDGTIILRDVDTGKERRLPRPRWNTVSCLAFSPGGKTLASGESDGTITLWNPEAAREKARLQGHSEMVISLAFTPDASALISGSFDKTIRRWAALDQPMATLTGFETHTRFVAFTPDGRKLVAGSTDKSVQVFDTRTGERIHTLEGHKNVVVSGAVSPDGKTLATGGQKIRLWNIETGEPIGTLTGHESVVRGMAYSPDGKILVSGSKDKLIKLWDVEKGEVLRALPRQENRIYGVAVSPDGKMFATATSDYREPNVIGRVTLWDMATGRQIEVLPEFPTWYYTVAFSADGKKLFYGDAKGRIRGWDIENHSMVMDLKCEERAYSFALIPPGDLMAVAGRPGTVSIWDLGTSERVAVYGGHSIITYVVANSPDGTLIATGGGDNTIKLWPMPNAQKREGTSAAQIRLWSQ